MSGTSNNTKFMNPHFFLKIALILLAPALVWAQAPMYVDVSQCRNITVDLVRVACYDKLADMALRRNGTAPAVDQTRLPPVQTVPQGNVNDQLREKNRQMRAELAQLRKAESGGAGDPNRVSRFGHQPQIIATNEDGRDILYDRIQSLQRGPDGWIITLASGQIWKQLYGRDYGLKEGQEVKIEPGFLGSRYHLTVSELKSFIYVERLR